MSSIRFRIFTAAIAMIAMGGCTDTSSATDLNPAGPPEIAQIRLTERVAQTTGAPIERTVFAFGTHPQAGADIEHMVTSAKATGNKLRIIMDELLVGNNLEEIQCRGVVDDDAFSSVPLGDTPDDIARCAVASDALAKSCPGDDARSVCICQNTGGCGTVPMGQPVGVLDINQDGAADNTSFKKGAVGIHCSAGANAVDVPIDLDASYWNPSGNQEVPAMGGFDALGPAIVLVPAPAPGAAAGSESDLPTNMTCGLTFDPSVVDKQGIEVCAPPDGDFRANNSEGCTPGDLSQFTFSTEPLTISVQGIADGQTGVSPTNDLILTSNAPIKDTTISSITLTDMGGAAADFTPMLSMPKIIRLHPNTPLANNTQYTITIPTTVTDAYGQGMPAAVVVHFTTVM